MAPELPSNAALEAYYLHRDLDVTVYNEDAVTGAAPFTTASGTISKVSIDGAEGVYLTVDVFIPVEDIPALPGAEFSP